MSPSEINDKLNMSDNDLVKSEPDIDQQNYEENFKKMQQRIADCVSQLKDSAESLLLLQSMVKDEPCLTLLTYKVTQEITEVLKQFRALLVIEGNDKS